eukprot:365625-Chlamydomonas_euryale.AAC.21
MCSSCTLQFSRARLSAIRRLSCTSSPPTSLRTAGALSRAGGRHHHLLDTFNVTLPHPPRAHALPRPPSLHLLPSPPLQVRFHVHEGTEHPLADAVARYVESGVPPAMADFLAIVIDGKEGDASMSEYFHMLEVAKALFGVSDGDDAYYTVSTAVASVMMGM